ncbi:MAG: hypothetical protein EAZ62_00725 [Sphingobacteriia bacterium]|nr:MAG: hypothetical protein EAZ62_00725 [Sphingobacteriia bacterium]
MKMIQRNSILLVLFCLGQHLVAQDSLLSKPAAFQSFSDSIVKDRHLVHKTNLAVLTAWSGVNILQGSISATNAKGVDKAFFQMNAYWNVVNLGLATYGWIRLRQDTQKEWTLAQNTKAQHQVEKLLLLNTGLDLAYLSTGLYLKERGNRLNNPQTEGFGNSLLLQGTFLLVFDLVQYQRHRRNGKALENKMGEWQLVPAGMGLGLVYNFR